MKAKDFKELNYPEWEIDFNEEYFGVPGEDSLNLTNSTNDITVSIRDEGDDLIIEWNSDDDGDQILFIPSDNKKTIQEIYEILIDNLNQLI